MTLNSNHTVSLIIPFTLILYTASALILKINYKK